MHQVRYQEHPIPAPLTPFVKLVWSLESDRSVYGAPRERILPDGCVEMVFHFHEPFCTHFPNGQSVIQPLSFVVGQMQQFIDISPRGRIGFVAVRFHAQGAYRFLPGSLRTVAADVVDVVDIWKRSQTGWCEQIAAATNMNSRLAIVEANLFAALRSNRAQDPIVDRCLQLIESHSGEKRIRHLAFESVRARASFVVDLKTPSVLVQRNSLALPDFVTRCASSA